MLLSALTPLLVLLANPPIGLWPVIFVAFTPMVVAQHRVLPRRWSWVAPAVGIGGSYAVAFLPGLRDGQVALVFQLMPLYVAGIAALVAGRSRAFAERTAYRWIALSAPVGWAAIDFVRSSGSETLGGTWGFHAYALHAHPLLLQPLSVFGIIGLQLLVLLPSWAVAGVVLRGRAGRPAAVVVACLLVGWAAASALMIDSGQATVRVAAVQNGLANDDEHAEARLKRYTAQTLDAARQGARLIVWNEAGLTFDPQREHTAELRSLAAEADAYLVLGYLVEEADGRTRNATTLLSPDGKFLGVYGKDHPGTFAGDVNDFQGDFPVYDTEFGQLATIICYDLDYTDTARIMARGGARLHRDALVRRALDRGDPLHPPGVPGHREPRVDGEGRQPLRFHGDRSVGACGEQVGRSRRRHPGNPRRRRPPGQRSLPVGVVRQLVRLGHGGGRGRLRHRRSGPTTARPVPEMIMRTMRLALVVAVAAALLALAPTSAAEAAGIRYRDQVFGQTVVTRRDVVYGSAYDYRGIRQDLRLDVHEPKGDRAGGRPAVVWVHGGYFQRGDKAMEYYRPVVDSFTRAGYVTVSIDYRLNPTTPPGVDAVVLQGRLDEYIDTVRDAQYDAQAAIRWVRAHSDELRVDPERVAIVGHSAGALTANMVAFNHEDPGSSGNPGWSSRPAAAVAMAGGSLPLKMTQVDPGEPPLLVVHGVADLVVPAVAWPPSCVATLALLNVCEVIVDPDQDHDPFGLPEIRDFLYRWVANRPAAQVPVAATVVGTESLADPASAQRMAERVLDLVGD